MRCCNFLAFTAVSFVAATQLPTSYVPLTFWANYGILEHPSNDFASMKANAEFSVDQISNTVSFLQDNEDSLQDSLNARSPYEVMYPRAKAVVLFVRDTLRLDELENFEGTPVEGIYRNASSSVAYPHTIRSSSDSLTGLLHPQHTVAIENVKDYFQEKTLGSTYNTDLVVVSISNSLSWTEAAKLIRSSVALFDHISGNRVIYGLTGDKSTDLSDEFGGFHRNLLAAASIVAPLVCPPGSYLSTAHAEPFCFTHYVNMTPAILTGLILGLFFILAVYVGLYSLDSIQTPLKYPSVGPPKGKEY